MKKTLIYSLLLLVTVALFQSCGSRKGLSQKEYNDLVKTHRELKKNLPDAKLELKDDRIHVTLNENLLFELNKYDINKNYHPSLVLMANTLNKYPKTNILITGYTDNTGTQKFNQELSKKRADAARDFLIQNGVNKNRLYTWGLGDKDPVASNDTEEGRRQNRRVEFVIMYNYNAQ